MTGTVQDVLNRKGWEVVSVHPGVSVSEGVALMSQRQVGSVLAMEGPRLHGILTERDVIRRVLMASIDPHTTALADVMTRNVRCAPANTSIDDAVWLMTEERHRQLPIVEQGTVIGVLSIGDLLKWIAQDLNQHIADLSSMMWGPAARPSSITLPPLTKPRRWFAVDHRQYDDG